MRAADMPTDLPGLLAEYERVSAAMLANFNRPTGGRGKQGLRRTDAAIRRGAKYAEELWHLERQIRALGGEIPRDEPEPEPAPKRVPPPAPAVPSHWQRLAAMTQEELQAEDARLDQERHASGCWSISDEHRAVKSELGRRAGERARVAAKARRSAAAKRGARTRAARKAAGLPPKHLECFMPPPGGWTDADRVS